MTKLAVNEKRLVDTFIKLVQIDSPSGSEDQIISYLQNLFQKLSVELTKDSYGNLIVKIPGKGESFLLSAHVDTVEPGKGIQPVIKDGIIKSGGSTILGADNKAAVAAILEAVSFVHETKLVTCPLEIVFTKSEEVANLGAVNLDYRIITAKVGYIFDYSSTIGTIILGSPYYNSFDIKIFGRAAHASRPKQGINVLSIFNTAFSTLKMGKITNKTLVNIGVVMAGDVRNTVPGKMLIKGEVRSFVENEVEEVTKFIIKTFSKAAHRFEGSIEYSAQRENPGYEYSRKDQLVQKTSKIMQRIGLIPIFEKGWGCSDANIFKEHGIKTLNLGNGALNAHTVEEYIAVKDLKRLIKLILGLITRKE